jgi:hypothetical protein
MTGRDVKSDERSAMLRVIDEAAVRQVIGNYFYAVDRRDFIMLKDCFTEDAKGEYDAGKVVYEGRDAILDGLQGIVQFKSTSHVTSSMFISIDGEDAKADTFAVAFLVLEGIPRVLVRGLQYIDHLVRTRAGWRIGRRIHIPRWQYEVASVEPAHFQVKERKP